MDSGRILAVGSSLNLNNTINHYDLHHLITDEYGMPVYNQVYSIPDVSISGRAVIKSQNSNTIYSAGFICDFRVESPSYCDYYFSKLNAEGDTVFFKTYERLDTCDLLTGMIQTKPNRIVLMGYTCNDTTTANRDAMFITVDTLGNVINQVVWGGSRLDYVRNGLVMNEFGEALILGYTASYAGSDNDSWVLNIDSIGNVNWHQVYNHISNQGDACSGITLQPDGNYILSGNGDVGTSETDFYLMKIDQSGGVIWTREYALPGTQGFWWSQGLEDGTVYSCGATAETNDQGGMLVKSDLNGDTIWMRTYNPSGGNDLLYNMKILSNGDIVMVGQGRDSVPSTQDGWLIRVDQYGCVIENCHSVGIEEVGTKWEGIVWVYPNPVSDILTISVPPELQIEIVRLINIHGQIVSENPNSRTIDVRGLANGVYVLQIQSNDGKLYHNRIVVEH
ncbi:MAG: T9SS type A sorting domain-containing protein [Flavobacteriales bacterium]